MDGKILFLSAVVIICVFIAFIVIHTSKHSPRKGLLVEFSLEITHLFKLKIDVCQQ